MREYLRRRRLDPEFRRIANARTMKHRQTLSGAKKHAEANARYREKYPDRVKETMRRVDQQPHRVAKNKLYWSQLDKSVKSAWAKVWSARRRLKVNENGGSCTLEQWQDRCSLYGNCCAYCGTSLESKVEIDHVIPVSKGGSSWPSNLVPACRSCNARKHAARWQPKLPKPATDYFRF